MIYCLDTNIIIAVIRNQAKPIAKLKATEALEIKVSEVVRAELLFGCLKSNQPDKEQLKVEHVIGPFERLPFSDDAVEHYASIRDDLERDGKIIGPNDLLIAATARSAGAVMVTANKKEFSRVPGLVVEDWT